MYVPLSVQLVLTLILLWYSGADSVQLGSAVAAGGEKFL